MNSNNSKAALFALLLFGFGATVGALGHRYYTATVVGAKTSEDWRHKYISEMQTKLKLNQRQVDQLQVILDDTRAKVKAVRDLYHPEMVKIKDDQLTKVKSILSADQAKQYEAMVAEREQHAREQEERDHQEEQRQHEAHLKALGSQSK
jgi:hypothetical protein